MNRRKSGYPAVHVGTSFMLVIFIVLCLAVFAILSLTSALRDYSYSEKSAQRTTAYYEACNQAEDTLALIDTILAKASDTATDDATYKDNAIEALQSLDDITVNADSSEEGLMSIQYSVPAGTGQALEVELNVYAPSQHTDTYYTIKTWEKVSTEEWDGDDTLPLLH
jgi:hypothetical protein